MHAYRTHNCGYLRAEHIGQTVRLSGWCHRIRDHGGVLFVDLRDNNGVIQCVIDPESSAFELAETFRSEYVVRLDGVVRGRPVIDGARTQNTKMATGMIEIYVTDAEVLGEAAELPLPVFGDQDYPEETRLEYRFLDLRRERIHNNIMLRGRVVSTPCARA